MDAACGAGLYVGMLLEAGHEVFGTDQSSGMLARAREIYPQERFPCLRFEKCKLQELDFYNEFNGVICIDALEHICPEDWPGILAGFNRSLKLGGMLYVTVDTLEMGDYRQAFERAQRMGLPVLFGEVADELDSVYAQVMERDALDPNAISGARLDLSVYHYHPAMHQVRLWFDQSGLAIEEEGIGDEYVHILARKNRA
jgi:ubiquinone/menaquinone biosynthesis C-methylase UbiE